MANLTTTDLDNGKTDLDTLSTVVNSQTESTTSTRLGDTVKTLNGLTDDFEQAIINSGYQVLGSFASGVTITAVNQVLDYDGGLYRTTETLPYTTDGATPDLDSGEWVVASDGVISGIARALNVLDSEVIYSTDTVTILDDVLYIYDAINQVTWGKPSSVGAGETIVSVTGDSLTTSGSTYTIYKSISSDPLSFDSVQSMVSSLTPNGDAIDKSLLTGLIASTTSYYAGWAAQSLPPIGGARYIYVTNSDYLNIRGSSDLLGIIDHDVGDGVVAMYAEKNHIYFAQAGAKNDNSTDIGPAVNACLLLGTGKVKAGKNTFSLGSQVTLADNETLDLTGSTINVPTTFRTDTGFINVFKTTEGDSFATTPIAKATGKIRIKGGEIDMQYGGPGDGLKVPDTSITHCFVFGAFNDSVAQQVNNVSIKGTTFKNIPGDAILSYAGKKLKVKECAGERIYTNESQSAGALVHTLGTQRVWEIDNSYDHAGANGLSWHMLVNLDWALVNAKNVYVKGNLLVSNDNGHFVSFEANDSTLGVENAIVSGNASLESGFGFCHAQNAKSVTLSGNIASNMTYFCKFDGADIIKGSDNQITNTDYTAWVSNGGNTTVSLTGNIARNIGILGDADSTDPLAQNGYFYLTNAASPDARVTVRDDVDSVQGFGVLVNNFGIADVSHCKILNFGQQSGAAANSLFGIKVQIGGSSNRELSKVTDNTLFGAANAGLGIDSCEGSNVRNNDIDGTFSVGKYRFISRQTNGSSDTFTNIAHDSDQFKYDAIGNHLEVWVDTVNGSLACTKGDIQYITNTAAGGYIGYTCVSSFLPIEWKGYGLIEA